MDSLLPQFVGVTSSPEVFRLLYFVAHDGLQIVAVQQAVLLYEKRKLFQHVPKATSLSTTRTHCRGL